MTFSESAYLTWLRQPANKREVAAQLSTLLSLIGRDKGNVIECLVQEEVRQEALVELIKWNDRLKPSPKRDRIGNAAVRFWVAQTLSTTVMRKQALEADFDYGADVNEIMEQGADGIFEFANSQFVAVRDIAETVTDWLKSSGKVRPLIVESPLGNSIPVQIVRDLAEQKEISLCAYTWNTPRNDRASRGATVDQAAADLAEVAKDHDAVVYIDDVSTGTRFLKIYDAITKNLTKDVLLPIALVVNDTQRPENAQHQNRKRLLECLSQQSSLLGVEHVWTEMPLLRLFRLDEGPYCRWERALIWEDSDLMAGKRKLNLIFTIIDHVFDILVDLAATESVFRPHLEHAWSQDLSGQSYIKAPGLVQSVFAGMLFDLNISDIKSLIETEARVKFSQDYSGHFSGAADNADYVKERWDWLRGTYLTEVTKKLGEQRAIVSWRAADNVFASSLHQNSPKPGRDQSATPYTISFNTTIKKLNQQLRSRILKCV